MNHPDGGRYHVEANECANDAGRAQLLRDVESMTEAEARIRLAGERARNSKGNRHE